VFIRVLFVRSDQAQTQDIKNVLIDAVRDIESKLPVDALTGRLTVPSLRILLPADPSAPSIVYRNGGDTQTVWFVSVSNQNQAIANMRSAQTLEGVFSQLKTVQVCARQVEVSFDSAEPTDSSDKLTLKSTKKLADGRTAHIYTNECPIGAEPILRYLDKMQSF
jgi:hypothetical protein